MAMYKSRSSAVAQKAHVALHHTGNGHIYNPTTMQRSHCKHICCTYGFHVKFLSWPFIWPWITLDYQSH